MLSEGAYENEMRTGGRYGWETGCTKNNCAALTNLRFIDVAKENQFENDNLPKKKSILLNSLTIYLG